jgi:hypothetical protein
MDWKPPRKARPRDQWGQFRSRADIAAEQRASRFDSLLIAAEDLYWQAEEERETDP